MPDNSYRVEHDSMGEVRVPADAEWGAQTQRAIENFPISGLPIEPALVRSLALIKAEAARVNMGLRDVPQVTKSVADAIAAAAEMVADGRFDADFPIDAFQTGSGTSSNMNANEVIARLASDALGDAIHPNDQVNASQSSNDVFPSAVHLAVALGLAEDLIPACEELVKSLRRKQRAFAKVVKSGRTHLMDATPVTLGQEFGGYASQVEDGIARLRDTLPRVCALPLGGTAVGTGINAPKQFAKRVIARLAERTGLPLTEAEDHFAAQGARRRARRMQRSAADPRHVAVQDRERHPAHGQRPAHRAGRDPDTGPATRLVDHARQGEPGDRRSRHPGERAGVRQRHRDRVRGLAGTLRAQRVRAVDRPQPARVDPVADVRVHCVRRTLHRRHRAQCRTDEAVRGVVTVDRYRAQSVPRLRGRGGDREGSDQDRPVRA